MKMTDEGITAYAKLDMFRPATSGKRAYLDALDRAVGKTEALIPRFGLRNPRISEPGQTVYKFCRPREWVAGFWPGQLWLCHLLTGGSHFRAAAQARRPYFQRFLDRHDWHNHDLGFLYSLSAVAEYKLTGDPVARAMALRAADALAARWRQPMPCLTCWNPLPRDAPEFARRKAGTIILDSVENMGLLFWAAKETGNPSYDRIARMHLDTCRDVLVRDDNTTFHCFEFDPNTGARRGGYTHQGAADDSCWARGQAWGIHGFAVAFMATGDESYRATALRLADHVAQVLPDHGVPPWDYALSDADTAARDSSAGAITAAGLYVLAEAMGDDADTAGSLVALADRILSGLLARCDLTGDPASEGLLGQGTAFHAAGLTDVLVPYGDYFFIEALMRAQGHTEFFWI